MSRKISLFAAAVPTPLTKRDFTLFMNTLPFASLLVQAATFPTEQVGEAAIPVSGTSVYVPTVYSVPGEWVFEVPDSTFLTIYYQLNTLLYTRRVFDVFLVPGQLSDAVIAGVSSGGNLLSGSASLRNWVGDISSMASAGASILLSGKILNRCFIKNIQDVQFSNRQDSGDAVVWRITVRYNYITPVSSDLGVNV